MGLGSRFVYLFISVAVGWVCDRSGRAIRAMNERSVELSRRGEEWKDLGRWLGGRDGGREGGKVMRGVGVDGWVEKVGVCVSVLWILGFFVLGWDRYGWVCE